MGPALLQFLGDGRKLDKFSAFFEGGRRNMRSLEAEVCYYALIIAACWRLSQPE